MGDTRTGAQRIADERKRQIAKEGWDPGHDDEHEDGELAWAATCYAAPEPIARIDWRGTPRDPWPWGAEWDKRPGPDAPPEQRIRALEKAGALIAAEIDRLLRATTREE